VTGFVTSTHRGGVAVTQNGVRGEAMTTAGDNISRRTTEAAVALTMNDITVDSGVPAET